MVYQLCRVVALNEIAFLIENVTILSDLYNMIARQHAEGELTLEVGGDRSICGAYLTSVNEERDTVDRDAGTVVEYEAGEFHIVFDEELYIVDEVRAWFRTEGDGTNIRIAVQVGRQSIDTREVLTPVGQSILIEITALVGLCCFLYAIVSRTDVHGDSCNT